MNEASVQRLDLLLLARLATAGPRPPAPSKLESDLFPLVEARLSRREWASQCAERLEALRAAGDVDERRVPTKTGLQRLRKALGVAELPAKWPAVWQALVPALVLELPGSRWQELAKADQLRARLIRRHRRLPVPETASLAQVVDAQAWQELGGPAKGKGKLGAQAVKLAIMEKALGIPVRTITEAVNAYCWTLLGEPAQVDFSMGKLRRVLLQRSLGKSLRAPTLSGAKVGELLATEAVGTTTSSIDVVRRSLVSRWIFGESGSGDRSSGEPRPAARAAGDAPPPSPAPPASPPPSVVAAEPLSLEPWAKQLQALADRSEHGRYGDDRVFIAAVWRAAQAVPALAEPSLEAFKARLLEANRKRLLQLHRADLVGAMDRNLVRESETSHLNATFHFIETHPRRTA